MKRLLRRESGWTLMEIVMVMIIIGVLGAVIIGQYGNINAHLMGQSAVLKSHLRFAQLRALNTSTIWGIRFNQGTYWLFKADEVDTPVQLPGSQDARIDLLTPYGLTAELGADSSNTAFFLAFDTSGRPGTQILNGEVAPSSDDLNILIIDVNSHASVPLTITAETGFIP